MPLNMESLDQQGRAELKREMARDYSRSERYVREATSRIDKDLKAELRETAFNMWMGCYSLQEISDAIGYDKGAISKSLDLEQLLKNATAGENQQSSENPPLTSEPDREFDEEDEDDSNGLGVYKLDKRLLIKANHLDDKFTPPIYNIWKQQNRSEQVTHFGNSEISFTNRPIQSPVSALSSPPSSVSSEILAIRRQPSTRPLLYLARTFQR
jgi:hypothetical protein